MTRYVADALVVLHEINAKRKVRPRSEMVMVFNDVHGPVVQPDMLMLLPFYIIPVERDRALICLPSFCVIGSEDKSHRVLAYNARCRAARRGGLQNSG